MCAHTDCRNELESQLRVVERDLHQIQQQLAAYTPASHQTMEQPYGECGECSEDGDCSEDGEYGSMVRMVIVVSMVREGQSGNDVLEEHSV